MAQSKGLLAPEERARIAELQDVLMKGLEGGRR
jgi:hypothetical protein